ncbi:Hypothetical_protein [Hexamita inflata]|uniref:Hypothetical_protein n=1 Tax=Hexamita inflata TaxID=28002 RepID=A0ABP1LM06_9EUKA
MKPETKHETAPHPRIDNLRFRLRIQISAAVKLSNSGGTYEIVQPIIRVSRNTRHYAKSFQLCSIVFRCADFMLSQNFRDLRVFDSIVTAEYTPDEALCKFVGTPALYVVLAILQNLFCNNQNTYHLHPWNLDTFEFTYNCIQVLLQIQVLSHANSLASYIIQFRNSKECGTQTSRSGSVAVYWKCEAAAICWCGVCFKRFQRTGSWQFHPRSFAAWRYQMSSPFDY